MIVKREKKRQVEMAFFPLIDVILLLLIFFMLTSKFITQTAHNIDLPDSKTATVLKDKEIKIFITKDHEIFLNDQQTDMQQLPLLIKPILDADPEKVVVLKADAETQLGYSIQIVDIVKENGGKRLTITTEKNTD
ncbi:MAG TPA: biopolymer transporter ExbD [bacterium]|nr:biopolymer transporter ExbD [bacterium]